MRAGSFYPGCEAKNNKMSCCSSLLLVLLCCFENCEVAGDRVWGLVFIKKSVAVLLIGIFMYTYWYSIRSASAFFLMSKYNRILLNSIVEKFCGLRRLHFVNPQTKKTIFSDVSAELYSHQSGKTSVVVGLGIPIGSKCCID